MYVYLAPIPTYTYVYAPRTYMQTGHHIPAYIGGHT